MNFKRVVLSLEIEEDGQQIRYRKPVPGRFVSLSDVLHPQWRNRLKHLKKRQLRYVENCRLLIMNYSVYMMYIHADIGEIRESFLRINTQGMKVTAADAIFTKAEDLNLRDIRHEVREHLDDEFRDIPEMPILFAMAALQGGTEARGRALRRVIDRLEKDARQNLALRKSLSVDWHRLCTCFGKAVDFLRQEFRVLDRDYLYSDYMISMMALFYFWKGSGPSVKQKEEIRKWFWATTVGSRYSGRDFLRCLPSDLKFFRALAEKPQTRFTDRPQVDKIDVRRSQYAASTGITSAFYCMLLGRGPVSILDDGINPIPLDRYSTRANRKDRHHIFPRAVLRGQQVHPNHYNSICNICLLTAEENQMIGGRRPSSYLDELEANGTYFKKKMQRHLIPIHDESGVWSSNVKRGFNQFMKERCDLICKEFERQAGMRLFRRDD